MIRRRPRRSRLGRLALLALLSSAGCREELGPVRFRTTRVTGIVRLGSRPVGGGWVEFHPAEGTVGNLRSAPVAPDGTFAVDRVPVGVNQVGFQDIAVDPALGRIFHPLSSPIRRTIPEGPSARIEIDLLEEAIRFDKTRRGGA